TALAAALQRALSEGQAPARPARDFAEVELQWLAWHGSLLAEIDRAEDGMEAVAQTSEPIAAVIVIGEPSARCRASLEGQGGIAIAVAVDGEGGSLAAAKANRLAR